MLSCEGWDGVNGIRGVGKKIWGQIVKVKWYKIMRICGGRDTVGKMPGLGKVAV